MQPRMVAAWREIWSVADGTTDPLAPFGLVTIAPSGAEGAGDHLSAFRWAQTANYGVLPNPAMPRTFVAQAYDLNDPWYAPPRAVVFCAKAPLSPRLRNVVHAGRESPTTPSAR